MCLLSRALRMRALPRDRESLRGPGQVPGLCVVAVVAALGALAEPALGDLRRVGMLFDTCGEPPTPERRVGLALDAVAEPADATLFRWPQPSAHALVEAVVDLFRRGGVVVFLFAHATGMCTVRTAFAPRVSGLTARRSERGGKDDDDQGGSDERDGARGQRVSSTRASRGVVLGRRAVEKIGLGLTSHPVFLSGGEGGPHGVTRSSAPGRVRVSGDRRRRRTAATRGTRGAARRARQLARTHAASATST